MAFHSIVSSAGRPAWERSHGARMTDEAGRALRPHAAEQYYPMELVAVMAGRPAVGFDAGSDGTRLTAISAAGALGAPQVTAPVRLSTNGRPGVVVYTAVYGKKLAPIGFAALMIDGAHLAEHATDTLPPGARVAITDGDGLVAGAPGSGPGVTRRVAVAGRLWDVTVWSVPPHDRVAPLAIAGAGLIAAALGGVILALMARRERYTRVQLDRQTDARDRAEAGLRHREREMRTMFEAVPVGLFRTDADGVIRAVNEGWTRLTGIGRDGAIGIVWTDVVFADDRHVVSGWKDGLGTVRAAADHHRAEAETGRPPEFRVTGVDGLRWATCRMSRVDGPDGQAQWLGFMADTTVRREAEVHLRRSEEWMRGIVGGMSDGIVVFHLDGRVLWSNGAAQEMFGLAELELERSRFDDLLAGHAEDGGDELRAPDLAALSGGDPAALVGMRADGRGFPLRVMVRPSQKGDGHVAVIRDLSAAMEEEERARQRTLEQSALRTVATLAAEQSPVPAVAAAAVRQAGWLFGAYEAVALRLLPGGDAEVVGAYAASGDALEEGAVVPFTSELAAALDSAGTVTGAEAAPWRCPGRAVAGEMFAVVPVRVEQRLWGAMCLSFDDAASPSAMEASLTHFASLIAMSVAGAEQRDQLARLAGTDDLTGLANRRRCIGRLRAEIERGHRHRRPVSLALFDIDRFKSINDTHGHGTGDDVIREVAQRVTAVARQGETVARIGGEEFAWIMPEADLDGAAAAAERAAEAVRSAGFGVVGRVTVSVGVAEAGPDRSLEDVMLRADRALYRAKRDGRDRVCLDEAERSGSPGLPAESS